MKQNFWTWWVYKPTEAEMKKKWINELYIDIDSEWHHPESDKELVDYVELCKKYKIKPYIIINCFAAAHNQDKTLEQITQEAKDKIDYVVDVIDAHPVLDYIRSSSTRQVDTNYLYEVIDYAVSKDKAAKSSIMSFWKSWRFNQNYKEFYKRITICPMVYGTGLATHFWIWLHKLFFPNCEPCIRAWDTTKSEFIKQISLIRDNKYSIWKWNDWKKL
jgi:hypothetical protein